MATPNFTLTGTIQDLHGVADQGYCLITLCNYNSPPVITGTSVIANTQYKAACDGTGLFSVSIWGNDQITPSNTYYVIQCFSNNGPRTVPLAYSLTGSGTYDLTSLLPLNTPPAAGTLSTPAIQTYAPVAHQFLTGFNSSGFFSSAQPAFTDISGAVAASQLPTPTVSTLGGVKSLAAVSHKYLTQIGNDGSVSQAQPSVADLSDGSTGSGAVVLATSPSISSPTLTSASLTTPTVGSAGATFSGSSSGSTVLKASATASGTLTLPAATDTLVGQQTIDTLKNKTLTGASSGNNVILLNSQGSSGAITGNSSTQTLFTYTIPANTLRVGSVIRIIAAVNVTGTTTTNYALNFGTTAIGSNGVGQAGCIAYQAWIVCTGSSAHSAANSIQASNGIQLGMGFTNPTDSISGAITVSMTFNVGNTVTVAPRLWLVELIQ